MSASGTILQACAGLIAQLFHRTLVTVMVHVAPGGTVCWGSDATLWLMCATGGPNLNESGNVAAGSGGAYGSGDNGREKEVERQGEIVCI